MPTDRANAKLVISTATAAQRAASEDRLLVARGPAGLLVVIADGAGGIRGGARAAEMLVESMHANFLRVAGEGATASALRDSLRIVDGRIATDATAGETTAIALVVTDDQIVGASAGDSEAWLLGRGECNLLTAAQARARLGSGRADPASFVCSFTRGIVIAGTDGLFAYATSDSICRTVFSAPPDVIATRLINLVRLPRGDLADDTSVVVVARV